MTSPLPDPYNRLPRQRPLPEDVPEQIKSLSKYLTEVVFPAYEREENRVAELGLWMEGKQPMKGLRSQQQTEKRALLELSRSPWLGLAVSIYAQAMYVDGYRTPGEKKNANPWNIWTANNFHAHQIAVHRAAIGFGYSYVRVLPGEDDEGKDAAVMRGVSPRRGYALFDDPVGDDFPTYFFELMPDNRTYRWYDDELFHEFEKPTGGEFKYVGSTYHGTGVCPVVRYVNQMDLDGRCIGDVEPAVALAARIDKTDYDRLLVQHYNSWKIRWATGLEQAESDSDTAQDKRKLAQEDILVSSDPLVKFGSLDETNMDPFISAKQADVESLASILQLPSHLFTGKVINVSAEALATSRSQTTQKLLEKQTSMGVSHARTLRLAAAVQGDLADARDFEARISWQDVEVRSLAQAADAYGKIAQQLGVPKQFLWRFIPGVDAADVQEWTEHVMDNDEVAKFLRYYPQTEEAAKAAGQPQQQSFAANAERANKAGRPQQDSTSPPTQ